MFHIARQHGQHRPATMPHIPAGSLREEKPLYQIGIRPKAHDITLRTQVPTCSTSPASMDSTVRRRCHIYPPAASGRKNPFIRSELDRKLMILLCPPRCPHVPHRPPAWTAPSGDDATYTRRQPPGGKTPLSDRN